MTSGLRAHVETKSQVPVRTTSPLWASLQVPVRCSCPHINFHVSDPSGNANSDARTVSEVGQRWRVLPLHSQQGDFNPGRHVRRDVPKTSNETTSKVRTQGLASSFINETSKKRLRRPAQSLAQAHPTQRCQRTIPRGDFVTPMPVTGPPVRQLMRWRLFRRPIPEDHESAVGACTDPTSTSTHSTDCATTLHHSSSSCFCL